MSLKSIFADLKTIFVPKEKVHVTIDQVAYLKRFKGKEEAAFKVAMDARKFEIQMYWTRTAYFWTLTGAALAGFFASFDKIDNIYSFVISCIGIILSLGWALANKGSKYWHENWENHVQMLENFVIGPLHKTLLYRSAEVARPRYDYVSQIITGPSGFSVSKINSIFSWFFYLMWILLAIHLLPMSGWGEPFSIEWSYVPVVFVTLVFSFLLFRFSGSWAHDQEHRSRIFEEKIIKTKT